MGFLRRLYPSFLPRGMLAGWVGFSMQGVEVNHGGVVYVRRTGLIVWPIRGQITRFWLLFFLLGLKKKVWLFGYFLASFYFKVMLGKCFDLSLIIYV